MKFSFEATTSLKPEEIWQNYANVSNWFTWEDDLLDIQLSGAFKTGTKGEMTLKEMPPLAFELVEVTDQKSFCDETKIPELGSLFFNHELIQKEKGTIIRHSVSFHALDGCDSQAHLGFVAQVFSDVPQSIFALIQASTKN